jgi:hypothetical protein
MYGIAITGNSNTSDYNNRMVVLEVTGVLNAKVRNTHYTIKVPYARLSQTVQRICRAGGKIGNVTMASFSPSEVAETAEQKPIGETVAAETVEQIQINETVEQKPIVETVAAETVEQKSVEETVDAETVVVEIAPQPTSATSKKTTPKAKGMGEKPSKTTRRDRKPKSRQ